MDENNRKRKYEDDKAPSPNKRKKIEEKSNKLELKKI